MSLCQIPGEAPCGGLGCLGTSQCCEPAIDYGCYSTASCFTNTGSIGCLGTTRTMPTGTRPCYNYADAASIVDCGSAEWCFYCTKTASAFCHTDIVIGGLVPITAVSCNSTAGTDTYTIHSRTGIVTVTSATPTTAFITIIPSTRAVTSAPTPAFNPTTRNVLPAPTATMEPITPSTNTNPFASAPTHIQGPKTSPAVIAGVSLGAIFGLAIIGLLAVFLWRKGKRTPDAARYPPPMPVQSPGPPGYPPYGRDQTAYGASKTMHEVSG